jgi:hypothetical protein
MQIVNGKRRSVVSLLAYQHTITRGDVIVFEITFSRFRQGLECGPLPAPATLGIMARFLGGLRTLLPAAPKSLFCGDRTERHQ